MCSKFFFLFSCKKKILWLYTSTHPKYLTKMDLIWTVECFCHFIQYIVCGFFCCWSNFIWNFFLHKVCKGGHSLISSSKIEYLNHNCWYIEKFKPNHFMVSYLNLKNVRFNKMNSNHKSKSIQCNVEIYIVEAFGNPLISGNLIGFWRIFVYYDHSKILFWKYYHKILFAKKNKLKYFTVSGIFALDESFFFFLQRDHIWFNLVKLFSGMECKTFSMQNEENK